MLNLCTENEHIGQYPLLYTTILNVLEARGVVQAAAAIEEEEEEEDEEDEGEGEEDEDEDEGEEEEEDTTVIPRDEHIKCMEGTIQFHKVNIKSKDILNRNREDKVYNFLHFYY